MPDNSRSQLIHKGSNTIILDSYNANPTSMEAALNNFSKIISENKILFLGEMAELGDESVDEHKKILSMIDGNKYSNIILVGKYFGDLTTRNGGLHFDDSEKAAEWLKKNPIKNSFILIKGSRSTKMERILEAL